MKREGEREYEHVAKNSPFPCGSGSKPALSEGTPAGPVAWRFSTSEQTAMNTNVYFLFLRRGAEEIAS